MWLDASRCLQGIQWSVESLWGISEVTDHFWTCFTLFDSVKYNKLTDVGAQILGASLRNCQKIKRLRWENCVFICVSVWSLFKVSFASVFRSVSDFLSYRDTHYYVIIPPYPYANIFSLTLYLISECGTSVFHTEHLRDYRSRTAGSFGIRTTWNLFTRRLWTAVLLCLCISWIHVYTTQYIS